MKYYAVKNGRKIGIFTTWDDCKAQVDGFSGAIYKSFTSKSDAMSFLGEAIENKPAEDTAHPEKNCAIAYVDGSYNITTHEFSFGAVLFIGSKTLEFSQKFDNPDLCEMRNVAGEIKGAEFVMRYCMEHSIKKLDIYYDYEGIAAWAEGRWKRNKSGTIAYKTAFDEISPFVDIKFIKVKGHSGDKFNDRADRLAKDAVGNP